MDVDSVDKTKGILCYLATNADIFSPFGCAIFYIAVGAMPIGNAILCPRIVVSVLTLATSTKTRGSKWIRLKALI